MNITLNASRHGEAVSDSAGTPAGSVTRARLCGTRVWRGLGGAHGGDEPHLHLAVVAEGGRLRALASRQPALACTPPPGPARAPPATLLAPPGYARRPAPREFARLGPRRGPPPRSEGRAVPGGTVGWDWRDEPGEPGPRMVPRPEPAWA